MTRNNIITALIIVLAIVGVVGMWWDNDRRQESARSEVASVAASKDLKQLEVAVPGMFCAGCTASVEGFLSGVPGVQYVEAHMAPQRSATIVYDPNLTTKDAILQQSIFDTYGPVSVISEQDVQVGDVVNKQQRQASIPPDVQLLSTQVVELLQQQVQTGNDVGDIEQQLQTVSEDIDNDNFDQAKTKLISILNTLQNL